MIKFRLYYDKDKETTWINEMAEKGFAMTGFFAGFYKFDECEPGKYVYQIDCGDGFFSVSNNYREFMEEAGVEIVQKWGSWTILRKHASDGEFELYTDVDSQIEHYTKICKMFKCVTILELIGFLIEVFVTMQGVGWGILFMFIIGAFVIVLMRAVINTKRIIRELKERKGEFMEKRMDKVSPLLSSGLLLNCCALAVKESVSYPIAMAIQIMAIVLMLVGIYQSRSVFKE